MPETEIVEYLNTRLASALAAKEPHILSNQAIEHLVETGVQI